jgi:tripartite-type tricarboxylate transporter receptor subunit TctC
MAGTGPAMTTRSVSLNGKRFNARVDALPDIPAVAEFMPGYDVTGWVGIGAPAGTSPEIVSRLNAAINSALAAPGWRRRLADLGAPALGGSAGDFSRLIAGETEKWAQAV